MVLIKSKFTVYFEEPFWVAVYEQECNGKYQAAKTVFGPEPKDYEIYQFLNESQYDFRFSSPKRVESKIEKRINPKRLQRQINKQLHEAGVGTKAQQAIKLQYEENKLERKSFSKQMRVEEKERQFNLRQEKKKRKHRGH